MFMSTCASAAISLSCSGDSIKGCTSYKSVSSIDVLSAPSLASAGEKINVRVDWTGWHYGDNNHFAFFMKPTSGGSWRYIDSCYTYKSDSNTNNKYTMNCQITVPLDYSGYYYLSVTSNDYNGYCNPGESGVDVEKQGTIEVWASPSKSQCGSITWGPSSWSGPAVYYTSSQTWNGAESYKGYFYVQDSFYWDSTKLSKLKNVRNTVNMVYEFSRDKETWDGAWTDHITCYAAYYSDLPDNRLDIEEKDSWWLECAGAFGSIIDRIAGIVECTAAGCSDEYEILVLRYLSVDKWF